MRSRFPVAAGLGVLALVAGCVAVSWPGDSKLVPRHGGHPVGSLIRVQTVDQAHPQFYMYQSKSQRFALNLAIGVKIIAPETANCPDCDKYITPLLADPAAAAAVSIIATHDYGQDIGAYNKPQKAGKSFWETEWSQENSMGDTPDPSMTSALVMAKRMHVDLVTSGLNAAKVAGPSTNLIGPPERSRNQR